MARFRAAVDCPRCERVGLVSVEVFKPVLRFKVKWVPRPGGKYEARGIDIDSNLTREELLDPSFGCGYDKETT